MTFLSVLNLAYIKPLSSVAIITLSTYQAAQTVTHRGVCTPTPTAPTKRPLRDHSPAAQREANCPAALQQALVQQQSCRNHTSRQVDMQLNLICDDVACRYTVLRRIPMLSRWPRAVLCHGVLQRRPCTILTFTLHLLLFDYDHCAHLPAGSDTTPG
jgi:hypothetical protein